MIETLKRDFLVKLLVKNRMELINNFFMIFLFLNFKSNNYDIE